MTRISLSAIEKILKNSGANRVSKDAKIALATAFQLYGEEIGKKATRFALHSGRKTVTEKDIKLALKAPKRIKL